MLLGAGSYTNKPLVSPGTAAVVDERLGIPAVVASGVAPGSPLEPAKLKPANGS